MSDCYIEPFGPESIYSDETIYDSETQISINQQQDVINQQLLDQIQLTQTRLNDVYKWIINHELIHATQNSI